MTLKEFKESLFQNQPPEGLSVYLQALWQDSKGNWDLAHRLIQDLDDRGGAWIHAYLHRKEGDLFNADYWYRSASRKRPALSLDEERNELISYFLVNKGSVT